MQPLIIEGCLYDEETGELVTDGHITVSGTSIVNILEDGADGCYRIDVITAGTVMINVFPPFNYAYSDMCTPFTSEFDPTIDPIFPPPPCANLTIPITCMLGTDPVGNALPDFSCSSNPFTRKFVIEALDPEILNNNFPLRRLDSDVTVPVVSPIGYFFLVALLLGVAALGLPRTAKTAAIRGTGHPRRRRPRLLGD
jgi:hypothetical protein